MEQHWNYSLVLSISFYLNLVPIVVYFSMAGIRLEIYVLFPPVVEFRKIQISGRNLSEKEIAQKKHQTPIKKSISVYRLQNHYRLNKILGGGIINSVTNRVT
jgi:hypothetical protein